MHVENFVRANLSWIAIIIFSFLIGFKILSFFYKWAFIFHCMLPVVGLDQQSIKVFPLINSYCIFYTYTNKNHTNIK